MGVGELQGREAKEEANLIVRADHEAQTGVVTPGKDRREQVQDL